jgi:hypothetical protein
VPSEAVVEVPVLVDEPDDRKRLKQLLGNLSPEPVVNTPVLGAGRIACVTCRPEGHVAAGVVDDLDVHPLDRIGGRRTDNDAVGEVAAGRLRHPGGSLSLA